MDLIERYLQALKFALPPKRSATTSSRNFATVSSPRSKRKRQRLAIRSRKMSR